jgi:hypothetical protein
MEKTTGARPVSPTNEKGFFVGRADCLEFKPTEMVHAVVNPFLGPPEPHLLRLPTLLEAA